MILYTVQPYANVKDSAVSDIGADNQASDAKLQGTLAEQEALDASEQDDTVLPQPHGSERSIIVGVGASAGGLEALNEFVASLPENVPASFVIVQHMSSTYRSMLVELLQRKTKVVVEEACDGCLPRQGTIYVTPPSSSLVLKDGRFHLTAAPTKVVPKPSIDDFFFSLSEDKGEDAIGVILSGTGSDGANGMRQIKLQGGICFAQEPSTAKYSGMPLSAIDTGAVHRILAPSAIADEIVELLSSGSPVQPPEEDSSPTQSLAGLLSKVRRRTSVDFSGYKEGTLWRRIKRRMVATRMDSFAEYARFAEDNPEEMDLLFKDILISVTNFFRDKEAFASLRSVVADIVTAKDIGEEIRVWVSGCATGEEAYSIAILLAEQMNEHNKECRVQVFATDIDSEAMAVARRGVYAIGSMQEMDEELLRNYFVPLENGAHYEVSRRIRDMVVFARQDLTRDPPFLRLDLISCRNVLIYFAQELQSRVLNIFHYALAPNGYLFLGRSEGVHQQEDNFEILSKDAKLYRRLPGSGSRPPMFTAPAVLHNLDMERPRKDTGDGQDEFAEIAEAIFVPPSVLVDNQLEVVHVYGEVTPFLSITSGSPRFELLHLLRPEFRSDVQPLIFVAERKGKVAYGKQQKLKGTGTYRLAVHPVKGAGGKQLFMVAFEQVKRRRNDKRTEVTSEVRELEEQLIATRENLQTVIQELETSNEEMQALNEELQASNEELQSSNEELEASNEELQSTNEELTTVNEEMRVKSQQLQQLNNELQSVENSIPHPLLVADKNLNILRFNHAAGQAFQLSTEARGCQLPELPLPEGLEELSELAVKAMTKGKVVERRRIQGGGRIYMASAAPAWVEPGKMRGIIITLTDTTEASTAEDKIRESEALLLSIMDNSPSLVALKDLAGRYTFANEQYAHYFNLERHQLIGTTDNESIPSAVAAQFRERDLEAIRQSTAITRDDHIVVNGEERYLATTRFPLLDTQGHVTSVSTQAIDITARVRAEEQLRLAARVFEHSGEGIIVTDRNSVIVTVNDAFTRITGYPPEEAIGKTPNLLRSGKHDESFYEHMWWQLQEKGWWQGEIWNRRKDGSTYMEWLTINGVKDQHGNLLHYIGVFSDIDAVREGKDRLSYLATHDELTGLANRSLFQDRIQQLVAQSNRGGGNFAVIFIDLDHFKFVNDSAGHDAGDQLLISAASRLTEIVREEDTVSRLGGDEFGVLLRLGGSDSDIELTVSRILNTLAKPFQVAGRTVHVGASIGIAAFPRDGETVESLLKAADTAMYEAKGEGRDTFRFFSSELRDQIEERMSLETELRRALDKRELALHFQPRFCLSSGEIVGIESLLRWEHPEKGLIYPGQFIDVLEDTGLIVPVGQWVLGESLKQARAWHKAGLTNVPVSVNVSARQFRHADFDSLFELCRQADGMLEVELTERVLMADPESATQRMNDLRDLGVNIAMDDFGTGYSSLLYLKEFPINVIKLDRGFVANLPGNERDAAIARAVVSMAHALDLTVVAEGIETEAQADFVRYIGCEELQGFLTCRPQPAAEIAAMLARGTSISLGQGWEPA